MKHSYKNLFIEPYRIFFFFGALMAISTGLHWFFFFAPQADGVQALVMNRPKAQYHSYQMIFCTFQYFAFGFLFTAFPNWMDTEHPRGSFSLGIALALVASEFILFFGSKFEVAFVVLTVLQPVIFIVVIGSLCCWLKKSSAEVKTQPLMVIIALMFGAFGSLLGGLSLINEQWVEGYGFCVQVGLYQYILFLILGVAWRIFPFFTRKALQKEDIHPGKNSGIWFLVILSLRLVVQIFNYFLPGVLPFIDAPLMYGLDGVILVVLVRELIRWKVFHYGWEIMKKPILAVHYLALFWLMVYLFFSFLKFVIHFLSPSAEAVLLLHENDLLHFFTLGCVGTLILTVMIRVTQGHGGLPLKLGKLDGLAILCMQLGMFSRVLFHVFGEGVSVRHYAGIFWTLAFFLWSVRYFPVLFQEKVSKA